MFVTKVMFSVVTGAVNFKYLLSSRESLRFPLRGVGGGERETSQYSQIRDPVTHITNRLKSCRNLQVHILVALFQVQFKIYREVSTSVFKKYQEAFLLLQLHVSQLLLLRLKHVQILGLPQLVRRVPSTVHILVPLLGYLFRVSEGGCRHSDSKK